MIFNVFREYIMEKTIKCLCGKTYTQQPNLYRHRKNCEIYQQTVETANNDYKQQIEELQFKLLTCEQALAKKDNIIAMHEQTIKQRDQTIDHIVVIHEQTIKQLDQKIQNHEQTIKNHEQTIALNEEVIKKIITVMQPIPKITNPTPTPTPTPEPIKEPEVKKPSIKEYLDSCTPVLFDTFMKQYTPSIEDCSNILRYGLCEGAIRNFNAYINTYDKKCYPMVITNPQNIRMKLYLHEKQGEWKKLSNDDALKFIGSVVERMINRIWSNVVPIYTTKYPGFSDPTDPNIENYRNMKCSVMQSLRDSEKHTSKIVNKIKEHFCIFKDDE